MEGYGWAAGVMTALRWVAHLVAAQLLLVLGALAGGVVLGLFPALDAAGRLVARLPAGHPSSHPWRDFWAAWRGGWRRANVVGAPVWVVGLLVAADVRVVAEATGSVRVVLAASLVLVVTWAFVVLVHVPPVLRRYDADWRATWRFLAVAPALGPGTALAVLAVAVVWVATCWVAPVLVPLGGVAVPLLATGWLVDVRLDRIDAR